MLAVFGALTREVVFPVFLQHLAGIATALLLFAAVRRITGSAWAGLVPAAAVLLNPDLIYLEHSIMSEPWFVLACAGAVYAAVRAFDRPDPSTDGRCSPERSAAPARCCAPRGCS